VPADDSRSALEALARRLDDAVERLARDAEVAAEVYARSLALLDAASVEAERAAIRADRAERTAATSLRRVAAGVARSARTAGGELPVDVPVELLVAPGRDGGPRADDRRAADLLERLGRTDRGTGATGGSHDRALQDRALADRADARAQSEQAELAELARRALFADTKRLLGEAKAASQAAIAGVAELAPELDRVRAELGEPPFEADMPHPASVPTPADGASVASGPAAVPSPGERAAEAARAQAGAPYAFAGVGPDAWDAPGLVRHAWAAVGVEIGGHSATGQHARMRERDRLVPLGSARAGDLLFIGDGVLMHRVAIALGDGTMLEGPRPGGRARIRGIDPAELWHEAGRPG
jgi:peptidoglycan DL-endopeptidase CwlO